MKKTFAAVLVAMMVLCMATTVFAAGSSASGTKVTGGATIAEIDPAAGVTSSDEAVQEIVKDLEGVDAKNVTFVDSFDLTSENKVVDIYNAAFKDGDQILVLHWNGTEWEQVGVFTAKDGMVNVDFTKTGLSPVAFYKVGTESAAAAGTSPKTGESPVLPMMMIICAAGLVYCVRKQRA